MRNEKWNAVVDWSAAPRRPISPLHHRARLQWGPFHFSISLLNRLILLTYASRSNGDVFRSSATSRQVELPRWAHLGDLARPRGR